MLFLSGQISQDQRSTSLKECDESTEQIGKNARSTIAAGGANSGPAWESQASERVYSRYLTPPYPARLTVQVSGLPMAAAVKMGMVGT